MGGAVAAALLVWACSSDESEPSGPTSTATGAGTGGQSTGGQHAGGTGGGTGGTTAQGGAGGGGLPVVQESEPNDGTTVTEYNDLALGAIMQGAIATPGDSDIFLLPTTGATPYEATLDATGSSLVPHLTVLDDGRGGDDAGDDYVKIVRTAGGSVRIQWMAMGTGGYLLAVRDARNVDGQSVGDDTFTYELTGTTIAAASVTVGPLPVTGSPTGSLSMPGAIALYTFSGTAGQDVLVDMQATDDLDGRLYIVADATSDWIARQDDRSVSDNNPLIDAPLTASGNMTLVVESIAETPTNLGYSLTASLQ